MSDHDRGQMKHMPQIASHLALRLGADPDCPFRTAGLSQTDMMRIGQESRLWLQFTARQTISARTCAVPLNTRFRPLGNMLCAPPRHDEDVVATTRGFGGRTVQEVQGDSKRMSALSREARR